VSEMTITFFGISKSFGYWQIGGTDSFYRRIGQELVRLGHSVEFVHYACEQEDTQETSSGITIATFQDFQKALDYLASREGPVVVNAIAARDRLSFIRFRRRLAKQSRFHMVYSYYAPTFHGRLKHFLEALILPYNGGAICMSQRLAGCAARFRNKAAFVLPPVPQNYYCPIDAKTQHVNRPLVVTYVGRLEEGKGIREAIDILERLATHDRFECRIYGYSFDGDRLADDYHDRITGNNTILYRRLTHKSWSLDMEVQLATALRETDFLLLPYQTVSSSIDTPLLLLEGMANLCCCITRPLAEIPNLYGDSPFLINDKSVDGFASKASELIEQADDHLLEAERMRLDARRDSLAFDLPSVAKRMLEILSDRH